MVASVSSDRSHSRRQLPDERARRWAEHVNRLVLSAQLIGRGQLRYTPAGLPAIDLSLKHESEVVQDGQPRRVAMEIRARAIGAICERTLDLEMGTAHGFTGFLGSQRNGRGIVFHITELD